MDDKKPTPDRHWVIDYDQHPEVLIERHRQGSMFPEVHAAYARRVREKAEKDGLVHIDLATGYRSRFHPAAPTTTTGKKAA